MSEHTKGPVERTKRFRRRDDLPPEGEGGLAMSPRRSYSNTAVVLSPEDYDSLLDCRDLLSEAMEALRKASTCSSIPDYVMELIRSVLAKRKQNNE